MMKFAFFRWQPILLQRTTIFVLAALLAGSGALPAAAQKNKDKKKEAQAEAAAAMDSKSIMALPDAQSIDRAVSEMLGYWQIGDADALHKYYSDDVVVVSGEWQPPVIGWGNYVKAYQAQRARITGGRMDRSNTLLKVNGTTAWVTYQFLFSATVDGKSGEFRGHTSLVLNKQGDRWVIVLNHSSAVGDAGTTQASAAR